MTVKRYSFEKEASHQLSASHESTWCWGHSLPLPPRPEPASTGPSSASGPLLLPCEQAHLCHVSGFHRYVLLALLAFLFLTHFALCNRRKALPPHRSDSVCSCYGWYRVAWREGTYVYLGLIQAVVQQKPIQHCKAIFLPLKNKKRKRKKNLKLKKPQLLGQESACAYTDLRDLLSRLKLRKWNLAMVNTCCLQRPLALTRAALLSERISKLCSISSKDFESNSSSCGCWENTL